MHIAVLCPEVPGHFNPMSTLLGELLDRGHRVTWIGTEDGVDLARQRGFEVRTVGRRVFPRGTLQERVARLGQLAGWAAMRYTLQQYQEAMRVLLEEGPDVVGALAPDLLLADESAFAARTIAEVAQRPWISVCNALPMHPDSDHPPSIPGWRYRADGWGRLRNRAGYALVRWTLRGISGEIATARRRHGLPAYGWLAENASRLATLVQMPEAFDLPRREPAPWLHYVGSLHEAQRRPPVSFPSEQLDGRPLVYASLGTIQNRLLPVFRAIAEACRSLPAQLVISLGGGARREALGNLPGDPLVVEFAPQLELLSKARLVITHAGMNTTMEALAQGVPLVAVPITNDQPAVAARIAYRGCGEVVSVGQATASRLARVIQQVYHDPSYGEAAQRIAAANRLAGGAPRAAEIIEQSVREVGSG